MKTVLFNDNWSFLKTELGVNELSDTYMKENHMEFQEVHIPHDWLIYDSNNLYEDSIGWYKKEITVRKEKDIKYVIHFDGVYMDSYFYVNGVLVGEWKYGYSSFEYDITDKLLDGNNILLMKVVHQSPNSRWYSGAGIHRDITWKERYKDHIVTDGVYVSTRKKGEDFLVICSTELNIETCNLVQGKLEEDIKDKKEFLKDTKEDGKTSSRNYVVMQEIIDKEGKLVAKEESTVKLVEGVSTSYQELLIKEPKLWGIKNPYLYTLNTYLMQEDKVVDVVTQNIGLRTIRFTPNDGFFLNDESIKIHGVCEHHDFGALGAVFNKEALRRKFILLQEMGVNGVRTSHNMPPKQWMELADEMGMLIVSEGFDMWELKKTDYDYARFFAEWVERDVASWIRRDRNHPSVILWSIGNEIYDTHASERGLEITIMLRDLVKGHDTRENAYVTFGSNFIPWENTQRCAEELGIVGYNYQEQLYEEHHKKYPEWVIYGSETASTIQSRGIYHFPASYSSVTYLDEQCSSLGNCATAWGAKNPESVITMDRDATFTFGQFIWTGFDYIGEPTPYSTKNSYFGQLDTAGFKKDSYYMYQSMWTDYKENPMVHILPYWDYNDGQMIDIKVYSNGKSVELFLNNQSKGRVQLDKEHGYGSKEGQAIYGQWKLPYEKGTLVAVAYDENDNVIAEERSSSFGDSKEIKLTANKDTLVASGLDLSYIEITTLDEVGNEVKNGNNRVHVTVEGAGHLVGLDNGDSTDYESYKGSSRKLFSGKLMAIIQSTKEAGRITVTVESVGLKSSSIELTSIPIVEIANEKYTNHMECVANIERSDKVGSIATKLEIEGVVKEKEDIEAKEYTARLGSDVQKQEMTSNKLLQQDEVPIRRINLTRSSNGRLNKDVPTCTLTATLLPKESSYKDIYWRVVTAGGIKSNIASIVSIETQITLNDTITIKALGDGEFRVQCYSYNGTSRPVIISEYEYVVEELGQCVTNPYEFVPAALHTSRWSIDTGKEGGVATKDNEETQIVFDNVDFGTYGSDEVTIPIYSLSQDGIEVELWEGIKGEENSIKLYETIYKKEPIWNTYQSETYKIGKRLKGLTTFTIILKRRVEVQGFQFTKFERALQQLHIIENDGIYGDSYTYRDGKIEGIGNNVTIQLKDMDFTIPCNHITICGRARVESGVTLHLRITSNGSVRTEILEIPYSDSYKVMDFTIGHVSGLCEIEFVTLPGSNLDMDYFKFW